MALGPAKFALVLGIVLAMAVMTNCNRCVDLAVAKITDKNVYTAALQDSAFIGDTRSMQMMLDRGADVKAFDITGRTALMYAAASDVLPLDAVAALPWAMGGVARPARAHD